jgi:hypothetical protein
VAEMPQRKNPTDFSHGSVKQHDLYLALQKNKGKKFTAKQLAEYIGTGAGSVAGTLNRMRKFPVSKQFSYTKIPKPNMMGEYIYWWGKSSD